MTVPCNVADLLVAYINRIFKDPVMPDIPPELANVAGLSDIRANVKALRDILEAFARGDFSPNIHMRGVVAGRLKTLQAGLLHLCWQIQQVAGGDFTQRVDFLGEFATSFNSMVAQLDEALTALRHKERELTRLTIALQHEIEQKNELLDALSQSETRFRYMAEHDALTGVCNRRSFYNLAVMELERSRKNSVSCVLMMIDIDHFKHFNDTYGHLNGDAALRHLTQVIKKELRDQDIFGRYGGEEFVLLFPGGNAKTGLSIAERLRRAVAASGVETKSDGKIPVTISIGIIPVLPDGTEECKVSCLEKYLAAADSALYKAKESGRNRVAISFE